MNAAGSPLYRARFQWQPTLTAHDPDNILTLENAPVVYTVTGDVALTFAVASPQTATYAEPVAVALTFAVASPLAATYAEPASVALTFAVASPQTATYAEPVDVTLTFGVASAFEYIAGTVDYSVTGDVALTFGVDSPFEYVAGSVEAPSSRGGRPIPLSENPLKATIFAPPVPVTYVFTTSVSAPSFSVAGKLSVTYSPSADVSMPGFSVYSAHSVTRVQLQIAGRVIAPVFAFSSIVKVVRVEEEELLLLGVL